MADRKPDDDENTRRSPEDAENPSMHRVERRGSSVKRGGRRASDQRGAPPDQDGDKSEDDKDEGKKDDEDKDDEDKDKGDEDKGDDKDKDEDDDQGDDDKKKGDKDGKKKDKPSPLKKPWVRIVLVIVAVIVIVALVWWLIYYFTKGRYLQSTDDAYIKADKVAVTATVSAKVVRIAIVDNQIVKAGDVLLELDTRSSDARIRQYDALAAQSRAEAEQYRMQIAAQQATITQYAAQARGADIQRGYYAGEAERYAPLIAAGAERDEQLAQLLEERDKAGEDARQYRAAELAARRQIDVLRTQVAQAEAKVGQAEAQRTQTAVDVGNSIVRAAVDGRVGDRQVFPGTYVNTGTQMMTIIPIHAIYVEANFKETQIGLMRIGQPVSIKVDALDDGKVTGTVESFQPATGAEFSVLPPQNATGNFTKIVQRVPVRIHLDAGDEARKVLVPGLSVVVDVDTIGDKRYYDRLDQEEDQRADQVKERRTRENDFERDHREPGAGR